LKGRGWTKPRIFQRGVSEVRLAFLRRRGGAILRKTQVLRLASLAQDDSIFSKGTSETGHSLKRPDQAPPELIDPLKIAPVSLALAHFNAKNHTEIACMKGSGVAMSHSQNFETLFPGPAMPHSRFSRWRVFTSGKLTGCFAVLALLAAGSLCAAAQTQTANAGERQPALTELTGKLRVGTEFFLNRTETKETVEKHFKLMHENGITVVRIFVIWDDIERTPGNWDLSHYQWIYDAAAKNGIKIAATLCTEDPPGWMNMTTFYHQHANLDNPELKAHAAVYLEKFVGHFKDHPGTGEWLLMNEPTKYHEDASTFKAFGSWLQKKYGTVDELNKHWFRPVQSFDEVRIDEKETPNYWLDEEEFLDWKQFNVDNLIANLAWIRENVLAIDSKHPVHFNVTAPTGDAEGQDVWKEKAVTDILGVSMHTAWAVPPATPEANYGELYSYRLDLIASAAFAEPRKPFWVTELQSGPTIYTGQFSLTVSPQDLTRWMWDSYGAGANSVVFWLWHPRDFGTEAGEWGLVGLEGQPTVRLPAVKAVAQVLDKNPSLASQQPQQARVAILYDRDAALVNDLDGKWQTRRDNNRINDVQDALKGCYLALMRAHIPTQYVDIDQLKRGEVNKFPVLYAPVAYAMDEATINALKDYVKQGGTLWADGITAWKNERGKIYPTIPGRLTDLFGVEAVEIYPVQPSHPYSVTPDNELGGELWKMPLEVKGAEVALRDGEGYPFAVKNTYGKGHVYYFESAVTLAYLRRGNPIVHQWILEPALSQVSEMPIQLKQGSDHLLFRGLMGASGSTAILTNWGETQIAVVCFKGIHKVKNAVTGEEVAVTTGNGNTLATVSVAAGTSAVLMTE
jgi:beta-galactosidase